MNSFLSRVNLLILNEIRLKSTIYLLLVAISFIFLVFNFWGSDSPLFQTLDTLFSLQNSNFIQQNNAAHKFHLVWFPRVLIISSSIFTSLSFTEYHPNNIANFHLSLPATKMEKWVSKVILSVIIFPLVFVVLYQLFALTSYKWNTDLVRLGISDPYLWKYFKDTIFLQCVIMLAAIAYKKYSIFKAILALAVVYVLYNFIELVSFKIFREDIAFVWNGNIPGITSLVDFIDQAGYLINSSFLESHAGIQPNKLLPYIALISLYLSYLKYTEIES